MRGEEYMRFLGWARSVSVLGGLSVVLLAMFEPALANDPIRGAPGPLIGIGLPIAGVVLVALMVARSFRRND